jgi:hypothetical protein
LRPNPAAYHGGNRKAVAVKKLLILLVIGAIIALVIKKGCADSTP